MKNTLKKVITLLLAVMMCVSLTACSSKPVDEEVKYKDTFTYAIGGGISNLDPACGGDSVTAYVTNQICYGLYHIGEDGSMVADSVESYEISDDGLVYTFHLRENKWSDGEPVVAQHFVDGVIHALTMSSADCGYKYFIYDYIKGADKYADAGFTRDQITDIGYVALDDHTLQATLNAPCAYFISLLSSGCYYPTRIEYTVDGDYTWATNTDVPTSGPYHPTYIDLADKVEMAKSEYFWNAEEVTTSKLIGKVVEDMDAQLMQFQAGDIDFASAVDATVVTKLYTREEGILDVTGAINYYMAINGHNDDCPALANRDVRRALQLGIDRQIICDALDAGDVYYPIYSFLPDGMPGISDDWNDEAGILVYTDYDEAIALLEGAGYKADANGVRLTLHYSTNASTMHSTIAEVVKSEYAKIGVEVIIEMAELRTFFSNRTNGNFEICRNAFSADYMDPSVYLNLLLKYRQSVWNSGDDTYDAMFNAAELMSGNERLQALHDAEKYYIETMAYTNPLFGYGNATLKKAGTLNTVSSPQANNLFWYVKVPA